MRKMYGANLILLNYIKPSKAFYHLITQKYYRDFLGEKRAGSFKWKEKEEGGGKVVYTVKVSYNKINTVD